MDDSRVDSIIDSVLQSFEQVNPVVYSNPDKSVENFLAAITVFACFGLLFVAFMYFGFGPQMSWRNGRFPWYFRYKKTNLHLAFVCLGIELLKRDRTEVKETIQFMSAYLDRRFPGVEDENYRYIITVMKLKITEVTVVSWLQRKMPKKERIQLIDFLVDLSFSNDLLTHSETKFIKRIAKEMGINAGHVKTIIEIRLEQRSKRESQQRKTTSYSRVSKKEQAIKILGLEANVDFAAIKSRYRSLVKKFHPDLFARMGEAEKKMAHERFVAINEAYTYLEEIC